MFTWRVHAAAATLAPVTATNSRRDRVIGASSEVIQRGIQVAPAHDGADVVAGLGERDPLDEDLGVVRALAGAPEGDARGAGIVGGEAADDDAVLLFQKRGEVG